MMSSVQDLKPERRGKCDVVVGIITLGAAVAEDGHQQLHHGLKIRLFVSPSLKKHVIANTCSLYDTFAR